LASLAVASSNRNLLAGSAIPLPHRPFDTLQRLTHYENVTTTLFQFFNNAWQYMAMADYPVPVVACVLNACFDD
jgi:hypothetical protein